MTEPAESARHASWIELFFDLVVVAGVGQLAHLLHGEPELADIGLYLVLYLAFWTTWACFTVYGNVAGEHTRIVTLLLAMAGLAVMAASVAGIHDDRANAFAIAYIAVRVLSGMVWRRGVLVVDWPVAQLSTGIVPWVVSLWFDDPVKFALWTLGVLLDLMIMFGVSATEMQERAEQRQVRRVEQDERRNARRPERRSERSQRRAEAVAGAIRPVHADPAHLAERLGLYVIIVLGEAVILLIAAASAVDWDRSLLAVVSGAFVLLVGIWALSVQFGYAGVPHLAIGALRPQVAMALHCFVTAAVAAVAAGLGAAAEHPHGSLPDSVVWLLCGSADRVTVGGLVWVLVLVVSWPLVAELRQRVR